METKFEKVVVDNIDEYEKLVRERLGLLYDDSPKSFVAEWYFDYGDSIDDDRLDENLSAEEIKQELIDDLYEGNDMYYVSADLLDDLISETNVGLDENIEDEYSEWEFKSELIGDYIEEDMNVEELLRQSEICVNVFPYQGENANTEGSELEIALEALVKRYVSPEEKLYYNLLDNNDELEEIINKNELLVRLFESQGYEFSDIGDEEKVKNSKFLSSLLNEISNNFLFGSAFITFLIKSDALEYLEYLRNEALEIVFKPSKGLMCGIFNPVVGSGSLLELELEKPFACPTKELFFQIESRRNNYGYTVNEVYGLMSSAWSKGFYFRVLKEGAC